MSQTIRAVTDRNRAPSRSARRQRLTRNDHLVLEGLRRFGQPTKAYDLLEALREEGVNAPMTVYRALTRLCEAGLVKKIESLNTYCAVPEDAEGAFSAFLICRFCGATAHRSVAREDLEAMFGDVVIAEVSIEVRSGCLNGPFPQLCRRDARAN